MLRHLKKKKLHERFNVDEAYYHSAGEGSAMLETVRSVLTLHYDRNIIDAVCEIVKLMRKRPSVFELFVIAEEVKHEI